MHTVSPTTGTIVIAQVRWEHPLDSPTLRDVRSQFTLIEKLLQLVVGTAERAEGNEDPGLIFKPVIDAELETTALLRIERWVLANGYLTDVVERWCRDKAGLRQRVRQTRLEEIHGPTEVRAQAREAAERAVKGLTEDLAGPQWLWLNEVVEGALRIAQEAERRTDEGLQNYERATHAAEGKRIVSVEEWGLVAGSMEAAMEFSDASLVAVQSAAASGIASLPDERDLPVLRISYQSPVELVLAVSGSIGALVAILDRLLSVSVRFKSREDEVEAERARLRRLIAEDDAARLAFDRLADTVSKSEPPALRVKDVFVGEQPEQRDE